MNPKRKLKHYIYKGVRLLHTRIKMGNNNNKEIQMITARLDRELNKSEDKIDMDIVNECFRRLDELQGGVCKKTDEELEAGLIKIKKRSEKIQAEIVKNEMERSCSTQRKVPLGRSVALAALSVFLVIGLSFSILALSLGGYSKAWARVSNSVKTLFNMNPSEKDTNGITIIKGDYYNTYNTVEELLKAENIDILYPAKLPDGVKIETIRYVNLLDGKYDILLSFNSPCFNMTFYNYQQNDFEKLSGYSTYQANSLTFYIFSSKKQDTIIYSAIAQNNNEEYLINSDTYENLILIIDNLKEVEK